MLKQLEGSHAVAEAIALCRPEVISCYPITPQTHIVEALSAMVKKGTLAPCEYMTVESEFAAMSALIGSSAMGARSYTATSSQGLLYMAEALWNASGLGLPIVMTDGNRAIGGPINIWNDHSDTMAMRDCGWIQLHAESNQEAVDLHIQAFKLAEQISMPVMVCVDGFILTHAYERVDIPDQAQVDAFLPKYEPRQVLDPNDPISIGAMVGPEAYMEVRYLLHERHLQALDVIPQISADFERQFGRIAGGLVRPYRCDDAETIVVAMGSVNGTIQDSIDDMREQGHKIGSMSICSFRPFPLKAIRAVLENATRVIVVEKNLAPGLGGILASNIRMALRGIAKPVSTVICGLGGRAIMKKSVTETLLKGHKDQLEDLSFIDMNWPAIERELAREKTTRRSGPMAENLMYAVSQDVMPEPVH
jgi:pyruvate ferredoxin oxidoreductase alpha subunit